MGGYVYSEVVLTYIKSKNLNFVIVALHPVATVTQKYVAKVCFYSSFVITKLDVVGVDNLGCERNKVRQKPIICFK